MTTRPSAITVEVERPAATRYLEDIFLQVRQHDRRIEELNARVNELVGNRQEARPAGRLVIARELRELSDLVTALENAASHLLAIVTPAALCRAEEAAVVAPEYQQGIFDMRGTSAEHYIRPIFEESGIADRFVTTGE